MDTWEIVLILLLLTVSVLVISNHEVPLSFISMLDNIYFQFIVLGMTLALSTVSPASAIVAVATLVIIYYVRNIVKIQMVQQAQLAQQAQQAQQESLNKGENAPRIEITEKHNVVNVTVDKETVDLALNPHPDKQINSGLLSAGKKNVMSDIEMPSPSCQNKTVESFASDFNKSKLMDNESRVMIPEVDSNIFAKGGNASPYNDEKLAPASRPFQGLAGQFDIMQMRPTTRSEKYEELDYMPMSGMGTNKFVINGSSIDDKILILQQGVKPSSMAPPNYIANAQPQATTH